MPSIRLRPDQVQWLKKTGNGAAAIRYAIRRYRRGDFTGMIINPVNDGEPLQVYSIANPDDLRRIPAGMLRAILDAHRMKPDEAISAALERQRLIVKEQWARLEAMAPRGFIAEPGRG